MKLSERDRHDKMTTKRIKTTKRQIKPLKRKNPLKDRVGLEVVCRKDKAEASLPLGPSDSCVFAVLVSFWSLQCESFTGWTMKTRRGDKRA